MNFEQIENLLKGIDDPVMKLETVMEIGRGLRQIPKDAICNEITGCSSLVQICRSGNNFYGDADSALVRGIVTIIVAAVDGKTPDEIRKMPLQLMINRLNINLGAARVNGINSMIRFLQNL